MARVKAKVSGGQDRLLPRTHQRPFVISTSTRVIASMVTSVSTVTRNITGTKGKTRVVKVEIADQDLKLSEEGGTTTSMDG